MRACLFRIASGGDDAWTALTLTDSDRQSLPEIGAEIPVAEFYEDVDFSETVTGD